MCAEGYDPELGAFTQAYGSRQLDASALFIPLTGFLPATDARVVSTIAALERELLHDGLLLRYRTDETDDGLPHGEGVFLACSFWLVDVYMLQGREDEARALFDRLAALANDVGLYAEEYDPSRQAAARQLPPGVHPPRTRARRRQALERRPRPALAEASGGERQPRTESWQPIERFARR